jgi:hypothetical protein
MLIRSRDEDVPVLFRNAPQFPKEMPRIFYVFDALQGEGEVKELISDRPLFV